MITADDVRALHTKYAPSPEAFDLIYTHCEIVSSIALQLAHRTGGLDEDLVRLGALVHDIGVYRLYGPDGRIPHGTYIRHGVVGAEILAAEGWPDALIRFCSCHTGVGITRADIARQGLPIPPGDYVAGTPEERAVMYADKFHTKTQPPAFLSADTYAAELLAKFGGEKAAAFAALRAEFGDPDLEGLRARYPHAYRDLR
ncbi:HD domain-containing protein [Streptomyces griseofuscus]|uniref:HD domain-containing protein n=1 Tax=Streptomyces griseofuscus TaxID=146922 RepID=UPI0033C0DC30